MTRIEPFRQLARLCRRKGIENVIICPGSRNAILTIAFTSEPGLKCYSISDERSAGYIALGMALQTGTTTVLICTSGTAALNFSPAVAEAFFQEIPLLILTADRPAEWIHQYDGQTIFQEEVYGRHVKKAFSWSEKQDKENLDLAEKHSLEALELCQSFPKGPVHINIPVSEPFYPDSVPEISEEWSTQYRGKNQETVDWEAFKNRLRAYPRRLLVVGQQSNERVKYLAGEFAERFGFVLVSDSIANILGGIKNQDQFLKGLAADKKAELVPDFLISTDMSLISKSLKLLLREGEIKEHWHVQDNPFHIDPFRSLTRKIKVNSRHFFEESLLLESVEPLVDFVNAWGNLETKAGAIIDHFFEKPIHSEFHFLQRLLTQSPGDILFHVGNSMSIRYINALQKYLPAGSGVYCNRGTSGIDGSLSTAVGQALKTDRPVICILGDLSFQYDKNALWNRYLPDNLKIVVLNNSGGIIFNMIEGPAKQSSFHDFFRTQQTNTARWIAREYGLHYFEADASGELNSQLSLFLESPQRSIFEFFSDYETNTRVFKEFLNV